MASKKIGGGGFPSRTSRKHPNNHEARRASAPFSDALRVALAEDVLATVVSCPQRRELYVRFRLQVPGMELVEDTVACDFWQCFEA